MKGVRYVFPNGLIVEFTHDKGCIQPAERWVAAHKRKAVHAKVEEFESEVPVNRSIHPDGSITDHLLHGN